MVELAAAVVGTVDRPDAVLAGQLGILAGADSLQHELHVGELVADGDEVLPGEGRLMILAGRHGAPGLHEALGDVALAPAVDLRVDGDAEGIVAGVHRLLHPVGDPGIVAAHIELVDLGARAALHDVLEAERGHRADQHPDIAGAGALGDGDATAGLEGFQRSDGRQHDGQADLLAEDFGGRIDLRNVAQHARLEGDRVESQPVAAQRGFGFGAADQIIPDIGIKPDFRRFYDLV